MEVDKGESQGNCKGIINKMLFKKRKENLIDLFIDKLLMHYIPRANFDITKGIFLSPVIQMTPHRNCPFEAKRSLGSAPQLMRH